MLIIEQYDLCGITEAGPYQLSVSKGSKFLKAEYYKGEFVLWYERDNNAPSLDQEVEYFKLASVGSVYLDTGTSWKLVCTTFVEYDKATFLFRRADEKSN